MPEFQHRDGELVVRLAADDGTAPEVVAQKINDEVGHGPPTRRVVIRLTAVSVGLLALVHQIVLDLAERASREGPKKRIQSSPSPSSRPSTPL